MPKRTIWLTAGVALGAGSTLWAERRVRRTIEQAAAKLAPDALVAEVGRTARHVAESTGDRFRDAYSEGRNEMQRREEQLWSDLANRGVAIMDDGLPATCRGIGRDKERAADRYPDSEPDPDSDPDTRTRPRRHRPRRMTPPGRPAGESPSAERNHLPTWATRLSGRDLRPGDGCQPTS